MQIQTLKIYNVRKFEQTILKDLNPKLNIIVGPNAQGKTSLLEALSLVTRLKSFKTSKLRELIRQGENEASVAVELKEPTASRVLLTFEGNKKSLKVDDQQVAKSKYPYRGGSISFIPDDLYLLKGTPEGRRNFLDDLVVQLDPSFVQFYQQLKKILKHRNKVLRSFKEGFGKEDSFELWTEELCRAAIPVYERREEVVDLLNKTLPQIYTALFSVRENVEAIYEHGYEGRPTLEKIRTRLERVEAGEKAIGYTLVGPHKDDLHFFINGMEARSFASQGQLRGVVIALKISELELTKAHRQWSPILLLDDIISELDDQRVAALIEFLAHYEGQLFVTTAEINKVKMLHERFSGFNLIDLKNEALQIPLKSPKMPSNSLLNAIS